MAKDDKTQRIPEPKTTKLSSSMRKQAQGGQETLKRAHVAGSAGANNKTNVYQPRHARGGNGGESLQDAKKQNAVVGSTPGKNGAKGKAIAVAITIILLICALGLSLAWGFGLFDKQEAPQQETTEDATVSDTTPTSESSGDGSDVSYTRYATGDVSLEYPSSWSVMTFEGAQTVVVTRGTVDDGYIKIAPTSVSSYATSSVTDISTMRAFISAVAQNEQMDIDIDDIAIEQRGDMWVASVPIADTIGSKDARGLQLIAASGDDAYLITALCPTDTYAQNWPYFQHVLDSISFDASAEFPDEGRD